MKQNPAVLLWQKLLLLLIVMTVSSFGEHPIDNVYITPTPNTACPGDPCHTLSQYAEQYYWNDISSNTTLVFLPGDHTLNVTISMGSDSDYTAQTSMKYFYYPYPSLTLLGSPSSLPGVTSRIICTWPAGFVFSDITELHISSLAFISCGHGDSAAVSILSVQNIKISNCIFQNNTNNLYSTNASNRQGSAVYVYNSTLTLTGNTFQNNSAGYLGGTLYAYTKNTVTVSENIFRNNYGYIGGALFAYIQNILTLSKNIFQNNSATQGGAIVAHSNNMLTLSDNTFQSNCVEYAGQGGAIVAYKNNTLAISDNIFQSNCAQRGGALFADRRNTLTLSVNTFQNNSAIHNGGALNAQTNNTITLSKNTFHSNSADIGGALFAYEINTLTLSVNTFQNNSANFSGGAIMAAYNTTLTLSENTFQNNSANNAGGALYATINNTLTLSENTFQNNSADFGGGALCAENSNTLHLSKNTFQNNSAPNGGALYSHLDNVFTFSGSEFQNNSANVSGGAIFVHENNSLTLTMNKFQNNSAHYTGGAFYAHKNNTLTFSENTFQSNSADYGSALFSKADNILGLSGNVFQNNCADSSGCVYVYINNTVTLSDNTFQNNSANYTGGALFVRQSEVNLTNNTFARNIAQSNGGAIYCFSNSSLNLYGSHRLCNNTARSGGGIAALECRIVLTGDLILDNNKADHGYGGGLYADHSHIMHIDGYTYFNNNHANRSGGGIYASRTKLYLKECITFLRNSALNGGGLLFTDDSKLYLHPNTTMKFINNSVHQKGGAIKVENNLFNHCVKTSCKFLLENECFFQIPTLRQYNTTTNISEITELNNVRLYFENNTALEAGATLYGGSVDNCSLSFINPFQNHLSYELYTCSNSGEVFDYIANSDEQSMEISSELLYICACDAEGGEPDCSVSSIKRSVYPGGRIEVPIIAYGQRNGTTPAVIQAISRDKITINVPENTQNIAHSCTHLNYTVQTHAVGTTQVLTLYGDSPCPPEERTTPLVPTNVITVHISICACPPGFELLRFQTVCNCAQRLQTYTNNCKIDDEKIERSREFWVGYMPNSTADGLILHPHCPFDYCTSKIMNLAVNDSDKQCSNNRTGLLCGKCGHNFSLALGTNRCLQCSNHYLWLIIVFAFAGVALVLFLLALRLTVAVGSINGLVFYANIFAMNSTIFFQPQVTNLLTVFIAWLNLDLGIETCFYNGMDAYTKAWLQFVFPVYVWALVGIIILISHYSSKVATILGTNPIAVLATLFLLSYTKFLRTIIVSLSYTLLEYPNNSQIAVWLYDGNISYLSNKHIPLFTVALVCLIVLFLPYTLFLFFSQWLRSKSGQWRIFHWVNDYRVLPFLDAYHAPYTDKHRYWTGLMLLVRCILFLLFAFNALGDPNVNLLAVGSVTAVLPIISAILGNRIYKTWYLNILELSFISNLCILALATLYIRSTGGNQNAVTFTSISIAFGTFVGIATYQLVQQLKHAPDIWRKVFRRNNTYEPVPQADLDHQDVCPPSPPDPSDGCATVTYINFRELLELNNDTELQEPCMEMDD